MHRAVPVMAAWYALMLAARILDDLEDGDTQGMPWAKLGASRTVNVATGLIMAAPLALLQLRQRGVTADKLLELLEATQRAALQVSAGQRDDLAQEEGWEKGWGIAEAKAGEPFALACRAGAMVGEGAPWQVDRLGEFGQHLGVLTQIADDISGVWKALGRSDLAAGRKTLPVLYALAVASPAARKRLCRLLNQAPRDAEAVLQAQWMLADLGALHALTIEAEVRQQRAKGALEALSMTSPAKVELLALVEKAALWKNERSDDACRSGG